MATSSGDTVERKRRGRGEGSITQGKDGRWVGRLTYYVDGERKRKPFYGHTRQEAARKLTAALKEQQDGLPVSNDRQTVAQFMASWLDGRHTLKDSTRDSYRRTITKRIEPHIGRLALSKVTPQHLSTLYSTLLSEGLASTTVRYVHIIIHQAFKQAVRWGLIARNPAQAVDAPRPRHYEVAPLTPEQSQELLSVARGDPFYALYVLALTTGMRSGEMLALKWADVDLRSSRLHVRRTVQSIGGAWVFGEPKTAKGRRTIALPSMAVEALREHRTAQLEARLAAGPLWEDLDLVFPNHSGRPLQRQNVQRMSFKPLLKRAGLPNIRFHDLRHSAATLLLTLGEHPKVVQERLGHATIAITMDIYSHVMPDMQRGAATKLDALFAAP
jgi:integrase